MNAVTILVQRIAWDNLRYPAVGCDVWGFVVKDEKESGLRCTDNHNPPKKMLWLLLQIITIQMNRPFLFIMLINLRTGQFTHATKVIRSLALRNVLIFSEILIIVIILFNMIITTIFLIMLINWNLFKDRAVYTCDEGYQIVGVEKVVCQTSGQVIIDKL